LLQTVVIRGKYEFTVEERLAIADDWIEAMGYLGRPKRNNNPKWESIVYASDVGTCGLCDEPYCEKHAEHYADCSCIGPDEDEVIYHEDGFRARRIKNE